MTKRTRTGQGLCGLFAVLTLAMLITPLAAQEIGEVEVVNVWAYGTPVGGPREDLNRNSPVYTDELLETVRTGELRIRFIDGTTLGMGSESTLVLDELVFDPAAADSMKLALASGFFHFVTGSIEKEAVLITTPSMEIGLRGTDLAISVDADGRTELGVRDGIATATPAAGGETVEVAAGQTATANLGDFSIGVSNGLSGSAQGTMPASGTGFGGRGTPGGPTGTDASEADLPREQSSGPSEPSEPDPAPSPSTSF